MGFVHIMDSDMSMARSDKSISDFITDSERY